MLKKSSAALIAFLALAACSSNQPHIIQATANSPDITITVGMATQIEMPDRGRVQTVVVGNPDLVTASQDTDVVTLSAKGGAGETNLIVRARNEDGDAKVYQYHITVQAR